MIAILIAVVVLAIITCLFSFGTWCLATAIVRDTLPNAHTEKLFQLGILSYFIAVFLILIIK